MTKNKKLIILVIAIVALAAIVAGASYAAWGNRKAQSDMEVELGGRVELIITVDNAANDEKKLVPSGQLDIAAQPTKFTDSKTLGTIDVAIDAEHTADNLALIYNVKNIFAVPVNKSLSQAIDLKSSLIDQGKSAQEIADTLRANGIVDLNVEHAYTDESNAQHTAPRYLTQKPSAGAKLSEGTDLLINFVGADTGALAANTKLKFDTTGINDAAQKYTISIEFLRKADDEFVTYEDFVNKKIVIQFYLEAVVAK